MDRPDVDLAATVATFAYLGEHLASALIIATPMYGTSRHTARVTVPHPSGRGELTRHADGAGRDAAVHGAVRLLVAALREHYLAMAEAARVPAPQPEALFA